MRIALAVEGTRGDVHPMLVLGGHLRAAGHSVVVCAPPDFRTDTEERGFDFHAVGGSVRALLTERAGALLGGAWQTLREARQHLHTSAPAQFAALPEATADADALVAAGVQVAAHSIAELHGIPYRYVAYCPSLLPSREHTPAMLSLAPLPRWANALAWRATLRVHGGLIGGLLDGERRRLGLAPVGDVFAHLLGARPLLAADAQLAPCPPDCGFEVEQLPALHALDGPELPAKLESFLAQGPPPVYLGFGSMADPDPASTTREVLRAVERVGCRALIGRGWAGLGSGPLPERVLAIGSVSHARLFPRLAGVVHHGGAGTTTTAARAGVPQLLVPHLFDQFYWANRVRQLGLGPPALGRRRLRADRLAPLLAELVENEVLAERARELGAALRSSAGAADVAARFARAAAGPER